MAEPRTPSIPRRTFLKLSAVTVGAVTNLGTAAGSDQIESRRPAPAPSRKATRPYNGEYSGAHVGHVAFPLGGIGAGMLCLEGTGALSHVSLRNHPEVFNEPAIFAAVSIKGRHQIARVLEGPVPPRKLFGPPGTGNGAAGATYGLPRFAKASFKARFP